MADWLTIWTNLGAMVGIFVSALGFMIAILQIRRSRSAAEAAETAATDTRGRLATRLTIDDLARASHKLHEITDLHLNQEWRRAIDRYYDVRVALADVRSQHPSLTDDQNSTIQSAIQQIETLEGIVVRAIREDSEPENLQRHDVALLRAQSMLDRLASELKLSV